MDEGLYTREPRDEASGDDNKVRTHARKLKNKDSARRYYEQKLRNGRSVCRFGIGMIKEERSYGN